MASPENGRAAGHGGPAPPSGDLCRPAPGPLTAQDAQDLVRATADAVWTYPRRAFADLVAYAAARPADAAPDRDPTAAMAACVGRFHRWAPWVPAPAKCLLRGFLLLLTLRRHGFDARWVFAVRTYPFEAHCWLQAGATILDDAPDRLGAYHPILVA